MIDELVTRIRAVAEGKKRVLIGIAGPPASGKSTLADTLATKLGTGAVVVPMDGFHLDNAILDQRSMRAVKGAPETFDVLGFNALLLRLASCERETLIPVFDRAADISRASARSIYQEDNILIIEGNYLLLKQTAWQDLRSLFDLTIFLDVPMEQLHRRLIKRWLDHGLTPEQARARAIENDLPNARLVVENSASADAVFVSSTI